MIPAGFERENAVIFFEKETGILVIQSGGDLYLEHWMVPISMGNGVVNYRLLARKWADAGPGQFHRPEGF